jgi:hypothetical protein
MMKRSNKMNISKNTWHFGVVADDFFFMEGWYPSRSLCLYFWQVVMRLFFGMGLGLLAASPLATAIVSLTGTFDTASPLVKLYASFGVIVSIFYGLILVCSISYLSVQGVKWVYNKLPRKYKEPKEHSNPKEPSIIIEYIKAKKAKVCPMLNFTD